MVKAEAEFREREEVEVEQKESAAQKSECKAITVEKIQC